MHTWKLTNSVFLLTDLIYNLMSRNCLKLPLEKKQSIDVAFNTTFRHIDNFISITNTHFHLYVNSIYMYPIELEKEYTTNSFTYASYLSILLNIDLNCKL